MTAPDARPPQHPRDIADAADVDLDLVAADREGLLDAGTAAALRELVGRDPAAAARHTELNAQLDGLAGVLAAQPAPVLPADIAVRLDAALTREVDERARHQRAVTAARRATPVRVRTRRFARALGGLVAAAAVAGGVVLVVRSPGVLGGGGGSASSGGAAGGALDSNSAAGGSSHGAVGGSRASNGSKGTRSSGARAATSAAAPSAAGLRPSALAGVLPRGGPPVSADTVAAAVRSLPAVTMLRRGVVPGAQRPPLPAGCLPPRLGGTVLAVRGVRFGGRPATLLVVRTVDPHTARALVLAACGRAPLLDRRVPLAPTR